MDQAVINGNMGALLRSQQGELDAVLMYNKLTEIVSEKDAAVFRQLAAEEGGHASFFHNYTKTVLQPKKTKSIVVPFVYRTLGRKTAYRLIAKGEYSAGEKYKTLVNTFSGVQSILDDEMRHGDMVMAMLKD